MPTQTEQVIIIGAGIAGIMAARTCTQLGVDPLVLDKGRSVGGRMATRRWGEMRLDHGAQAMRLDEPSLRPVLDALRTDRAIVPCKPANHPDFGPDHWCGADGMSRIPKHLSQDLRLRLSTRVTAVSSEADGFRILLENEAPLACRSLIVTTPIPQARELFRKGDLSLPETERLALETIRYTPCIALLFLLHHTPPNASWATEGAGDVALLIDHRRKGISSGGFTALSTPLAAKELLDSEPDDMAARLVPQVESHLKTHIDQWQTHLWRYAEVAQPYPAPCLPIPLRTPLVLAGDAFGSGRIQGAIISGIHAAQWIHHGT